VEIGSDVQGEWEVEEEEDKEQVKPLADEAVGVWLQSNFPGTLNVIGPVSRKLYKFPRGGARLEVDTEDVPGLLAKTFGGKSCCGSRAKPLPYFNVI
jgi:hypothetical protein